MDTRRLYAVTDVFPASRIEQDIKGRSAMEKKEGCTGNRSVSKKKSSFPLARYPIPLHRELRLQSESRVTTDSLANNISPARRDCGPIRRAAPGDLFSDCTLSNAPFRGYMRSLREPSAVL
ncbi:hypothetical protein EVAR_67030_1 [Eumeta japonica]|uniref:Uncharacterized protein n=1 Tax=Eumeta variegata TaxID=151549 RepID=A0A4C1ZXN1_EUMVA|nr:hypothetical protein EVAR_67030_1 [Eumeta japonica]